MRLQAGQRSFVHAVPSFVARRQGAGHWKDVESRRLLWPELGIPAQVVEFDDWSEVLESDCIHGATDVLIEYSWWPDLVARLKSGNRSLHVHVRAHNAEMLQYRVRAQVDWRNAYEGARYFYGMARVLMRDVRVRWSADTILGISPWDNRYYWNRLPGRGAVYYLPYYCPWPFLDRPQRIVDWFKRSRTVLCIPGGNDPISASMIDGFSSFARAAARERSPVRDWKFELSSGLFGVRVEPVDTPISMMAPVGNIWEKLGQVKAVAVLGQLGYGAKTTIIDALTAGCHVLVHPQLLRRLPVDVRQVCISCDPKAEDDVTRAVDLLLDPPVDAVHVNRDLREQALRGLRVLVGI